MPATAGTSRSAGTFWNRRDTAIARSTARMPEVFSAAKSGHKHKQGRMANEETTATIGITEC